MAKAKAKESKPELENEYLEWPRFVHAKGKESVQMDKEEYAKQDEYYVYPPKD